MKLAIGAGDTVAPFSSEHKKVQKEEEKKGDAKQRQSRQSFNAADGAGGE